MKVEDFKKMLEDLPIEGRISVLTDLLLIHSHSFIDTVYNFKPNFLPRGTLFEYQNSYPMIGIINKPVGLDTYEAVRISTFREVGLVWGDESFHEINKIARDVRKNDNGEVMTFRIKRENIKPMPSKAYLYELRPRFKNGKLQKHTIICWSFCDSFGEDIEVYFGRGEDSTTCLFIRKKEVDYIPTLYVD